MARLTIARAQGRNTLAVPSAWKVSRTIVSATPRPTSALRVMRAQASTPVTVPVTAGSAQSAIEPNVTVALAGGGATPGAWSQVSGPAVTLSGSGASASYVAPLLLATAVLRFAYTVAGQSALVEHTVLPATERAVLGGVEVPLLPRLT